jgi:tight adherence protein B
MPTLLATITALTVAGATFLLVVASARVLLARQQIRRRTQRLLETDAAGGQAGWPGLARRFAALSPGQRGAVCCLVLTPILLLTGVVVLGWMHGLLLAGGALLIAFWLVRDSRARRRDRLESQLVPALRMIAAGTESGYSVQQALERAAADSPAPIAEEFALVVRRVALGVSLEEALAELARRGGENFELLAHIVIVQYRAGGNLPALLMGLAANVQERLQFRDETRALTAQARYSGIVLALLPFGFLALIALVSPGYTHGLFASSQGRVILLACAALLTIGLVSIRAISHVEI